MSVGTRIQVRRDTAALFTSNNPTLLAGEPGYETDTGKFKIGDGSTAWTTLAYQGTGQALLVPTAVKTANYTAAANDFVVVDTQTTGNVTVTLPTAPTNNTRIGVKNVKALLGRSVTVTAGGSDVFNVAAGSATYPLPYKFEGVIFQYASSPAIWYVQSADIGTNPIGTAQLFTAGGTYTIPVGATLLEYVAVGAGGGGGAGATNSAAANTAGGSGGGAGAAASGTIAVGNNTQITVTIGAGGAGQTTVAAGGSGGGLGTQGSNTTLVGDGSGISVTAYGGSAGSGGTANTNTTNSGGAPGGAEFGNVQASTPSGASQQGPGTGGQGTQAGGNGGPGSGFIGGGGGAGVSSTTTLGGNGGSAGTLNQGGAKGSGQTATTSGAAGASAAANTGAGGGGGGGGTNNTGTGGAGGAGGSGWATIKVVG